jgi:hypothetical protein
VRRKQTRSRINWKAIQTEYVACPDEDQVSLRRLSAKYSLSLHDLGTHSAEEDWVEKRKRYQDELATATQRKLIQQQSDDRTRILTTVRGAINIITAKMQKIIADYNACKGPDGVMEDKKLAAWCARKDVQEMGLNDLDKMARLAMYLQGGVDFSIGISGETVEEMERKEAAVIWKALHEMKRSDDKKRVR